MTGHYYHVLTRSIAGYVVFRNDQEYGRMLDAFRFYRNEQLGVRFSWWLNLALKKYKGIKDGTARVRILAYCLMPTHIHLLLEQMKDDGISEFMQMVLNSYAKYFNTKTNRNGPLWESRFKNILVDTDEQALHLTRYINLNPSSAGIVSSPFDWQYSSLNEYLGKEVREPICDFRHVFTIHPAQYRKFVENRQDYQRKLQILKSCILD